MYASTLKTKTTIIIQWKKFLYIHIYSLLYNTFIIVLQTLYKPQTIITKLTDKNITSKTNDQLVYILHGGGGAWRGKSACRQS